MRVALYQNYPKFGDVENNVKQALAAVAPHSFDLLVLPELFATGYQFKSREEAMSYGEPVGSGFTFDAMKELAIQKKAVVIYGYPELEGGKIYNSAAAVMPEGSFVNYQKVHLFDTEKQIFEPGQTGFKTFDFNGARMGLMICFDWRFPESMRRLALDGAQIICHPANLVLPHCPQAMIIRALENNVFTVTADRIGVEERHGQRLEFIGRSRIIAPDGEVLAEAGDEEASFLSVDIDPSAADNKQINERNDLFADRRPHFY
jgi:predicted amidohydrolase